MVEADKRVLFIFCTPKINERTTHLNWKETEVKQKMNFSRDLHLKGYSIQWNA